MDNGRHKAITNDYAVWTSVCIAVMAIYRYSFLQANATCDFNCFCFYYYHDLTPQADQF